MFGLSGQETIGQPVGLLSPQGRTGEIKVILARIIAGQPVDHFGTERVRKDGTVFPVSLAVSPIRDIAGVVIGASTICRDVTEQVQAEKALGEAGRQYRLLAENASDLVVLASPDRVITWVSSSVTRKLGWATQDLIGTRLADLMHPEDVAATAALRDAVYSGHKVSQPTGGSVLRIRTKSGQYRWMSGDVTPVMDESGAHVGVVSGLRDVEALVMAREAAQADRVALRATLDSLLDPHVRCEAVRDDAGQIVDFRYVDTNPAACAYLEVDHQDLVGARMLDLMPGVSGAGLLAQYSHVVETGEPLVLDEVVHTREPPSGRQRHLDIRSTRVGDGLAQTWRDVTDRHTAARALAESEEQYRLLAENASDVVMRLSPDHVFEWVSGSVADVLGWQEPDLTGHQIEEFVFPEDLAWFRRVMAEAGPGSTARAEFRFRRSDDTYRWVACRTWAKVAQDGAPVALVGGLVDVQDRKTAEAQDLRRLDELEQYHRLTIGRENKILKLKKEIAHLKKYASANGGDPRPQPL